MDLSGPLIALGVMLIIAIVVIPSMLKIVRDYQRLVVFRLGKCIGP